MARMDLLKPYSTVKGLMGPLDSWLGPDDALRLGAYATYEAIYKNVPEAFKLIQRGNESNPIYIPSARILVEAKNRFLAKRWTYAIDPRLGSPADRLELERLLENLFRREQMWSKFATQKRYGLIRGDAVWQIVADETKPEGSRLSVYEIDPAAYFPIEDPWNPEKRLGCHLVDPVLMPDGKTVIKRQTYRKEDNGRISYELSWWETGAWDDRDESVKLKKAQAIPEGDHNRPVLFELDESITSIPVYHIKNNRTPGESFGSSELAGFERLIAAINQTMTDEDLTLVMQGLGMFWTNSGPPTDEDGNEIDWQLGPGYVVEIDADATFGRVAGVASVEPTLAHIGKMEASMREASGVPDLAVGIVDAQVAESGIALAFKMAPLLSGNEEKEGEILATMDHLIYDLITMWLPLFEGFESDARAASIVDDPMPVNRKATLDEVLTLLREGVISIAYAQQLIAEKLGYDFPSEMLADIVEEQAALADARNVDPFAARVAAELEEQQ